MTDLDALFGFGETPWEPVTLDITTDFWNQVESDWKYEPVNQLSDLSDNEDWTIFGIKQEKKDTIINSDLMWPGPLPECNPLEIMGNNGFAASDLLTQASPSRSLLKQSAERPETPPPIDGDEGLQFRHTVDLAVTTRRLLRDTASVAADHSYTLARNNFDGLGVQTPSDTGESEEEIDVVSLGTAPQTFHSPYYEWGSSGSSRSADSSYPSSLSGVPARQPVGRKRLVPPSPSAGLPGRKRGRRGRRANTDTDSEQGAPEIERRSLHNDMERQRRIGLKNRFDELKVLIPSIRDKERAPKVAILREAAALCRRLTDQAKAKKDALEKRDKLIARKRWLTRYYRRVLANLDYYH